MSKQNIKQIILILVSIIMFGIFKNMLSSTSNDELQKAIKNNAFLVDVRTPSEFAEGSVKGTINIPLDKLPNELNKLKNKQNIVVFCRSGNRSGQAKSFLEQNGFKNVTNGGTWQNVNNIISE